MYHCGCVRRALHRMGTSAKGTLLPLLAVCIFAGLASATLRGNAGDGDRVAVNLPGRSSEFTYEVTLRGGEGVSQWFDISSGPDLKDYNCDATMSLRMEGGDKDTGYYAVWWNFPSWWTQGEEHPPYDDERYGVYTPTGGLVSGVLSPDSTKVLSSANMLPSPYRKARSSFKESPGSMLLSVRKGEVPEGATLHIGLTINNCNHHHTELTMPPRVALQRPEGSDTVEWSQTVTDGFETAIHFNDAFSDNLFCQAEVYVEGVGKEGSASPDDALSFWYATWDPATGGQPSSISALPQGLAAMGRKGAVELDSASTLVGLSNIYTVHFRMMDIGGLDGVKISARVRDCVPWKQSDAVVV